ncbi:MAG: hypothetical protein Fues2KO_35480 [Fuerstiella sp.]
MSGMLSVATLPDRIDKNERRKRRSPPYSDSSRRWKHPHEFSDSDFLIDDVVRLADLMPEN